MNFWEARQAALEGKKVKRLFDNLNYEATWTKMILLIAHFGVMRHYLVRGKLLRSPNSM